jgi:hypothetical protein
MVFPADFSGFLETGKFREDKNKYIVPPAFAGGTYSEEFFRGSLPISKRICNNLETIKPERGMLIPVPAFTRPCHNAPLLAAGMDGIP